MKYIHFVFACTMIIAPLCGSAFGNTDQKSMIYNAEYTVNINEIVPLEQNYAFKIVDANEKSGDILVKIYNKGNEVEVETPFGDEDKPFTHVITIPETDEKDTDYIILKITPQHFDVKDDNIKIDVIIDQYLDPTLEDKDFLIVDTAKNPIIGENFSLEQGYILRPEQLKNKKVTFHLIMNNTIVKTQEMESGDIFCYSKTVNNSPRTILITKMEDYFESSNGTIVFLKGITQRYDPNPELNTVKSSSINNLTNYSKMDNITNKNFNSIPYISILIGIIVIIGASYLFLNRKHK